MAKLTLTREQRSRLFDGDAPAITGSGECPVSKDFVYELSKDLSLRVVRIETGHGIKNGRSVRTWQIFYEVTDKRDPVRLLRRTPPVHHYGDNEFDEHGYPLDRVQLDAEGFPTASTSEPSAYTSARLSVVAEAGEAPDPRWVEERAKQCRLRDLKSSEDPKREANRLKDSVGRARARGIDITAELDAIRQANDEIRRKLDDRAA